MLYREVCKRGVGGYGQKEEREGGGGGDCSSEISDLRFDYSLSILLKTGYICLHHVNNKLWLVLLLIETESTHICTHTPVG